MNVKLARSYRSKNGNVTFVYEVTGTVKDLKTYKEVQGDFYREDEKTDTPLWFTTRCIGHSGKLLVTTNNKIVPDMAEFDQAASLAQQYGGNFGQELAKHAAQSILGGRATTQDAAPAPASKPESTPENEEF